ncbi:unnamed protein product [Caenorhabditis brenneri]
MPSSHSNHWTTDPEYIDLVNYFIEKAKDVKSPISIHPLAREYKEKSGAEQTVRCLESRVYNLRSKIHTFAHIDTNTKVKLLFALSASVDAKFLKKLKKDALVEVDEKNRITHYKANDRSLKLRGDQSLSAKNRTAKLASKQSIRSWIIDYFENKNDANAVPRNEETNEMWNLIEWITKKCGNVDSPQNITRVAKDFVEECGIARASLTIRYRLHTYCREIQTLEFLDSHSQVKQLFCLSVKLNSDCLKKLRKTAVVEVDQKNRIIKYTANDGSLTLRGGHWGPGETKPELVMKTNKDNVATAVDSEEESDNERFYDSSDEYSSEEFDREFDSDDGNNDSEVAEGLVKSTNGAVDFDNDTPVRIRSPSGISIDNDIDFDPLTERTPRPEEIESREDEEKENDPGITENASIKTRYGRLSKKRHLNSEFSYNLAKPRTSATPRSTDSSSSKPAKQKKIAIEKEQASSSSNQSTSSSRSIIRSFGRSPSPSFSTEGRFERKKKKNAVKKHGQSGGDKDYESENDEYSMEYSSKESDSELHSKNDNDRLDGTEDLMESSTVDFENETPVRSRSPTDMPIDDNFDFGPPTERSHRSGQIEIRGNVNRNSGITGNAAVQSQKFETLPKSKTSSSTSHTPKLVASAESSSSKRPRTPSDKSMNPKEMNDNFSHDDPSIIDLNPYAGPLELPNEIEKDANVQQIPEPHPDVIEVPIKKEYAEEDQTSLKIVLKSFKSLILGLDTNGLSQLQMELDTKIEKTGRGVEISNKEVIMAMELLIVKLSKHGALKSSEEAISLRDILLMLRTIILNSSFNGLEVILKMLKGNIDQLKDLDKKVPVSKVDSVLRATIDSIKNVQSPMNIYQLVRDFKKKSGDAQAFGGLRHRILKIRLVIHKIEHIDTNTKVKVLFALSAPVNADFLKELRKDALVKVASVPKNKAEKEMRDFIEFITEKCKNVKSPLTFSQLTKDFNKHLRLSRTVDCVQKRVRTYCDEIQKAEFSDTPSKVKQLFGLGAKLSSDFLEKLQKDAVVEVDDLNRITKYTAKDGGLTLHGDHSHSAKNSIGQLASKRSHRTLINAYFNNKNNSNAVPKNDEEKEMGKLIELITEKCDTADTPLCITESTKEFNNNFGTSRSLLCICKRVKAYCNEIQKTQFLDTHSKVKQLFCLGATLDSNFLKELRKDASVEVDNSNRITKYTAKANTHTL